MAKRAAARPDLSEAEWAVMKVVWAAGPLGARQIFERLRPEHGWAYPTVKTLLRRMAAKGWIDYRAVGKAFLYRAAVRREKAVRRAVRDFSNRILDGLFAPVAAYLAEERSLTDEDVKNLEAIIRRHREQKGT